MGDDVGQAGLIDRRRRTRCSLGSRGQCDMAAAYADPHGFADVRLPTREGAGQFDAVREEPMVYGADFDADARRPHHSFGLPEASHGSYHAGGNETRREPCVNPTS